MAVMDWHSAPAASCPPNTVKARSHRAATKLNWTGQCRRRHYLFRLSRCSVRPFVWSDIIITISHERLEQFWQNWQGIFTRLYWWPVWILDVKGQGHSRPRYVVAKASMSTLERRSPTYIVSLCRRCERAFKRRCGQCQLGPRRHASRAALIDGDAAVDRRAERRIHRRRDAIDTVAPPRATDWLPHRMDGPTVSRDRGRESTDRRIDEPVGVVLMSAACVSAYSDDVISDVMPSADSAPIHHRRQRRLYSSSSSSRRQLTVVENAIRPRRQIDTVNR